MESCLEGCLVDNHSRKILPCFHVFCVEYLREFSRGKLSRKSSCPRCREKFVVPNKDLDNLPDNFFGRRLERLSSSDGKMREEDSEKEIKWETACDICSQLNDSKSVSSVAHCLDCGQYMCEICLDCHSRMRLSRTHQVLRASEYNRSVTELFSTGDRPCEIHPSEMERIFCEVCQIPLCTKCCAEEWHRGHRLVPVSRTSEAARAWITDKLFGIGDTKARARQLLESIEVERKRFEENVEHVKEEINEMKQKTLEEVSTTAQSLRGDLNDHNDKCTDEMMTLYSEVRRSCTEAEQLLSMISIIMKLVPDSATPQLSENFNKITTKLTSPPQFSNQEETWPSSPPGADHLLPMVNELLNDDMDTVTGHIGELDRQFKSIQSSLY